MKILGLDMSTHTGWSIIEGTNVDDAALKFYETIDLPKMTNDYCLEDYRFIAQAELLAKMVGNLIEEHKPDFIYVEQTNKGRNRTTQKQLEFLHYAVLKKIGSIGYSYKTRYADTSAWRNGLGVTLSKAERKNNQDLSKLKKAGLKKPKGTGKKTSKHIAVRMVNERFNLKLKLVDNNTAEAILIALYGLKVETKT